MYSNPAVLISGMRQLSHVRSWCGEHESLSELDVVKCRFVHVKASSLGFLVQFWFSVTVME